MSSWRTNRHFKYNMQQIELLMFPTPNSPTFLSFPISITSNSILLVALVKILDSSLISLFPPYILSNNLGNTVITFRICSGSKWPPSLLHLLIWLKSLLPSTSIIIVVSKKTFILNSCSFSMIYSQYSNTIILKSKWKHILYLLKSFQSWSPYSGPFAEIFSGHISFLNPSLGDISWVTQIIPDYLLSCLLNTAGTPTSQDLWLLISSTS